MAYIIKLLLNFCHVTSEQLLKVIACLCRMSIQKAGAVVGPLLKTPEVG